MAEIKRQTELDILRLLATLAVIMIHGGLNPLTDNLMIKYMYRGMHAAIVCSCFFHDFRKVFP